MKCEYCGHANLGGDPFDNSCRGCGADPDNPEFASDADAAADARIKMTPDDSSFDETLCPHCLSDEGMCDCQGEADEETEP